MLKKSSFLLAFFMLITVFYSSITPTQAIAAEKSKTAKDYLAGVSCMKQSTIRIEGKKTIYFDPFAIDGNPQDGDIVFITHTHGDHFAISEIQKVMKKGGTLVITADGEKQAKKAGFKKIVTVVPGKKYTVGGIKFQTVASYNTNKEFHKKDSQWVGYNVTMNSMNYYIAGDTDVIPEMKKVKADVAFLPIGGTYTMDAKEAASAANIIKPKVAVPVHFGDVVGTTQDARTFISLLDKKITGVQLKSLLNNVSVASQSAIKIVTDKVIYIDPYNISGEPKDADLIFITHTHGDHFSIADIKKIMKASTKIIITADGVESLVKEGFNNVIAVYPLESYTLNGLEFKTVPAYNLNKDFHKKDSNWVGYILNINNTSYYFAGDTDVIPEMKDFNVDVAFLPVGGTYTMNATEAAQAANIIKPLVVVPIHYGDVVGSAEDAKTFVDLIDDSIQGVILKK
jgi:L-ascorbate metabolism protein UlaG (beta-lactamase superfamily)